MEKGFVAFAGAWAYAMNERPLMVQKFDANWAASPPRFGYELMDYDLDFIGDMLLLALPKIDRVTIEAAWSHIGAGSSVERELQRWHEELSMYWASMIATARDLDAGREVTEASVRAHIDHQAGD